MYTPCIGLHCYTTTKIQKSKGVCKMVKEILNEIEKRKKNLSNLKKQFIRGEISENEFVETKCYIEGKIDGLSRALEIVEYYLDDYRGI